MTTIVTRAGKGSPLTHIEVDTNFTNLNTAKLEAGAIALGTAAAPSISFTGDTNTGIFSPGADTLAFAEGGVEAMRINNQQELLIGTSTRNANGGVLQLKSGITFPATAVAASDANTLDDYEEGTFTPSVVYSTTSTPTYANQVGYYTKIGRLVEVHMYLNWNESGSTGNLSIAGLPFTAGGGSFNRAAASILSLGLVGTTASLTGNTYENSTILPLYLNDNNGTIPTQANTDGDQDMYVAVTYST
jgi:hypothetical protein